MDLYLLSPDPRALQAFRDATDGDSRIRIQEATEPSAVPADSTSGAHGVLITDTDTFNAYPNDMDRLARVEGLHCAVSCPDDASAAPVRVRAGDRWEVLVAPTTASVRFRLNDWTAIEMLGHESHSQEERLRDAAAAIEASSQELTTLRQRVGLLDHQREKLADVLETQNMLSKLSQDLNCLDLDEIITICVTKIPLLVNARYASFYLHNVDEHRLELKRHNHGYRIDDVVRVTEDSRSAMVRAIKERRILLVRDFAEYERLNDLSVERPNARRYSSSSALIAPMLAGDRVVGVLNLADKRSGEPFDETKDLRPIEQISVLVGAAIRNWQLFQEVHVRAKCDAMTGFLNHQTFFDELEKEVLRVRRYHGALSILMIDVDRFKKINDTHGHQIGDRTLTHVARVVRLNVRDTDTPARYGGDEFAVILSQADVTRAKLVAERIRETVEAQTFTHDGKKVPLSLSIGVAQYRAGMSVLDFVNEADQALYEAKAKGRNRVEAMPEKTQA